MPGGPGGGPGGMPGGGPRAFGGTGRSGTGTGTAGKTATAAAAKKTLWYLDDSGKLAVALVGVGASDDSKTEITGADDLEGSRVIVKVKVQ